MAEDLNAPTFEAALAELEGIVARLERGDAPLEEAIALYERGAALKALCGKRLEEAQLKVEQIVAGPDGATRLEPAALG